jgi:transposase-like protein
LNNRAENSHQPTRQRERTMRCFTSPSHAQHFLSSFGPIRNTSARVGIGYAPRSTAGNVRVASRSGMK